MKIITLYLSLLVVLYIQQPPELTGIVTDKSSGAAVQDVIVRWMGSSHSSLTAADGKFTIALQPGYRKLVVSKPGWVERKIRVRGRDQLELVLKRKNRISTPPQPAEDLPPDTLTNDAPVEGTP